MVLSRLVHYTKNNAILSTKEQPWANIYNSTGYRWYGYLNFGVGNMGVYVWR